MRDKVVRGIDWLTTHTEAPKLLVELPLSVDTSSREVTQRVKTWREYAVIMAHGSVTVDGFWEPPVLRIVLSRPMNRAEMLREYAETQGKQDAKRTLTPEQVFHLSREAYRAIQRKDKWSPPKALGRVAIRTVSAFSGGTYSHHYGRKRKNGE